MDCIRIALAQWKSSVEEVPKGEIVEVGVRGLHTNYVTSTVLYRPHQHTPAIIYNFIKVISICYRSEAAMVV